jgi:hypothetical protein
VYDKSAVLACRIAWNYPLPDGNKRAAWACLVLFVDLNDGSWNDELPDTEDAVEAMLAVAAREVDERLGPTVRGEPASRARYRSLLSGVRVRHFGNSLVGSGSVSRWLGGRIGTRP